MGKLQLACEKKSEAQWAAQGCDDDLRMFLKNV